MDTEFESRPMNKTEREQINQFLNLIDIDPCILIIMLSFDDLVMSNANENTTIESTTKVRTRIRKRYSNIEMRYRKSFSDKNSTRLKEILARKSKYRIELRVIE